MSVDQKLSAIVCGFAVCSGAVAFAAEEEMPDTEFLEYLGMWEESDEDWLILENSMVAEQEDRSDPVPEGEKSPEKDDEG